MSRGPGRVMVAVMRVLDERRRPITTHEICVLALEVPPKPGGLRVPTHVEMTTVRRALGALREAGRVFDCGRRRGGRRTWASRKAAEDLAVWIAANHGEAALALFPDLVALAPTTASASEV